MLLTFTTNSTSTSTFLFLLKMSPFRPQVVARLAFFFFYFLSARIYDKILPVGNFFQHAGRCPWHFRYLCLVAYYIRLLRRKSYFLYNKILQNFTNSGFLNADGRPSIPETKYLDSIWISWNPPCTRYLRYPLTLRDIIDTLYGNFWIFTNACQMDISKC